MAKRCYYEILGLARGASEQDLKSSYRKLAKDCHPDANGGDKDAEQKFKELSEAYEILKDPQKRAAYDHMGHAAFEGPGTRSRLRARFRLVHVGHLRRPVRRVHGWPARPPALGRPRARRRSALQHGYRAAGGLCGQDCADPRAHQRHLHDLHRHRGESRHPADRLCDVRRTRQGPGNAGLLHDRAHVPWLPGPRRDHQRPLRAPATARAGW